MTHRNHSCSTARSRRDSNPIEAYETSCLEGTRNGAPGRLLLSNDDQRFSTTAGCRRSPSIPFPTHPRAVTRSYPILSTLPFSPSWIIDDARAPTMPPVIFFFLLPTVLYRDTSIVRKTVERVASCDLEKGRGTRLERSWV